MNKYYLITGCIAGGIFFISLLIDGIYDGDGRFRWVSIISFILAIGLFITGFFVKQKNTFRQIQDIYCNEGLPAGIKIVKNNTEYVLIDQDSNYLAQREILGVFEFSKTKAVLKDTDSCALKQVYFENFANPETKP